MANQMIALGVNPPQPVNMLKSATDVATLGALMQDVQGARGVQEAIAGGMAPTDPRLLQYGKRGQATYSAALEGRAAELDMAGKKADLIGSAANFVLNNPTPENFNSAVANLVRLGVYTPEEGQEALAEVQADPSRIRLIAEQQARQALSVKDQLMQMYSQDVGGAVQVMGVDPLTGRPQVLSRTGKSLTPAQQLQQQQAAQAAERQARVNALITGQGAAPQAPVNAMSTAQAFPVEGVPAAPAARGSAVNEIASIYGVQPPSPAATDVTGAPIPPAEAPTPREAEPVSEADQLLGQIIALDREAAATNNPEAAAAADRLRKSYEMLTKQGMKPSERYVPVGKNVFDREKSQFITPPTPDEVEELKPQLQKGERWNEEEGRVEAVPGSKLFIEQKQKHAKSLQTYEAVDTKSNQVFDKIDEILDEKNADAFAGNFGGYNAYVTRMLPGANSDLRMKIESLKSNMKAIGLELMRSGGSIGQMTEREWPIVEQMLGAIDPVLGEENARMEFQKIKARINQILQNARSIYQDEWGGTQYFKPISGASGETGKEDPLGIR